MISAQHNMQMQQAQLMSKIEHVFEWKFGGTEVLLMGEFNNWKGEVMNKVEPPDLLKPAGYT